MKSSDLFAFKQNSNIYEWCGNTYEWWTQCKLTLGILIQEKKSLAEKFDWGCEKPASVLENSVSSSTDLRSLDTDQSHLRDVIICIQHSSKKATLLPSFPRTVITKIIIKKSCYYNPVLTAASLFLGLISGI